MKRSNKLVSVGAASMLILTAIFVGVAARPSTDGTAAADGLCADSAGLPEGFGERSNAGMVRVPEGVVRLGTRGGYADETPSGDEIRVPTFWMDRTEVTNAQFGEFVKVTGYLTDAEKEGAAAVFRAPVRGKATSREFDWWVWLPGANWRLPEGPASAARAAPNEPVIHVTLRDALAYARWLGHDLPTEAEWEYAARGGGSAELIDREPRDPKGRPIANYWQGVFPDVNAKEDGYAAMAPVGCFPANGYGIFDMIGNVWELTGDRYTGAHQAHGNGDPRQAIATVDASLRRGERMVIKGGSFMCAANYCVRYRVSARHPNEADLPTSHVGFRTVLRDPRPNYTTVR